MLGLQGAISAAVLRELQIAIAPDYMTSRSTVRNAEVYDLYLRGRHVADRWDEEGLDESVTLLKRALDRDPTFADVAAELASTFYKQGAYGFLAPVTAFEQARRAAEMTFRIDSKSALAHYVLGEIHITYDWDWTAAQQKFQQVSALLPGSSDGLNGEAWLSVALGRWQDALRQTKAALRQDPLNPNSLEVMMVVQTSRGHLDEAEAAIRRALEIRPTYVWGHYFLGSILLLRGDRDAALLSMQQEATEFGKQQGLAHVYYAFGRNSGSNAALADMLEEQANENAFGIAEVYAFRGSPDEAMHWLERAYAQKDTSLRYVKADPMLRSLEADSRFNAFLRKMSCPSSNSRNGL